VVAVETLPVCRAIRQTPDLEVALLKEMRNLRLPQWAQVNVGCPQAHVEIKDGEAGALDV